MRAVTARIAARDVVTKRFVRGAFEQTDDVDAEPVAARSAHAPLPSRLEADTAASQPLT